METHKAFIDTYLQNLRECNFDRDQVKQIDLQKETVRAALIDPTQQIFDSCLDSLIHLAKSLSNEYVRHRFIFWTKKTIECMEKQSLLVSSSNQKKQTPPADLLQLKENLIMLRSDGYTFKSLPLLLEFQLDNLEDLKVAVENFYAKSDTIDSLVEIFKSFSKLAIFSSTDAYFDLIADKKRHIKSIEDFLFVLAHNLKFMTFTSNSYQSLYVSFELIEKFLYSLPYSYLHDLVFKFAMFVEMSKLASDKDGNDLGDKLIKCYETHNLSELCEVFRKRPTAAAALNIDYQEFSLDQLINTFLSLEYFELIVAIVVKAASTSSQCLNEQEFCTFMFLVLQNTVLLSETQLNQLLEHFNKIDLIKLENTSTVPLINYVCLHLNLLIAQHSLEPLMQQVNKLEGQEKTKLSTIEKTQFIIDMIRFYNESQDQDQDQKEQILIKVKEELKTLIDHRQLASDEIMACGKDPTRLDEMKKKLENQISEFNKLNITDNELNVISTNLNDDLNQIEYIREEIKKLDNLSQLNVLLREAPISTNEFLRTIMVDQLYEDEEKKLRLTNSKGVEFCNLMNKFSKYVGTKVKKYFVSDMSLIKEIEKLFKISKPEDLNTFDHFLFTRCEPMIKSLTLFELAKDPAESLRQLMPIFFDILCQLASGSTTADYDLEKECRKTFTIPLINQYLSTMPASIWIQMPLCIFIKELVDNEEIRVNTDDMIFKTLLITLYSLKDQEMQPIVSQRLFENQANFFIKTSLNYSKDKDIGPKKLEFCVRFLYIITAVNSAVTNANTAVSTQTMLAILENVLVNKDWLDSVQTRPNFLTFLSWFFASFRVFERDNSLEKVPISKANYVELNYFIDKLKIEDNASPLNYEEIFKGTLD